MISTHTQLDPDGDGVVVRFNREAAEAFIDLINASWDDVVGVDNGFNGTAMKMSLLFGELDV